MPSKPKIHTFNNGFRLVYQHSQTNISYIQLICRIGSIYEDDNTRGASHFIEHMCFKGTPKHPSARDIMSFYDNVGAYFNANTNKNYTAYVVKCHNSHLNKCASILGDLVLNSSFKKSEFDKELQVVIEENVKNMTDYEEMVFDELEKNVFEGTPYEYQVDTIEYHRPNKLLKHNPVLDLYHKYYVPENMVFSIVSKESIGDIIDILEKSAFTRFFSNKHHIEPILNVGLCTPIIAPTDSDITINTKNIANIGSIYLNLGFRTCSFHSPDNYLLKFLANLVGGTLSSRLYLLLREDNGLTYKSSVENINYEQSGIFTIFTITDYKKILKNGNRRGVLPLCIDMLNKLVKHGITETELTTTKHYMEGKLHMSLESGNSISLYNGLHLSLYNQTQIVPYHELYKTFYKNITISQINFMIRKYFKKTNMYLVMVGEKIPSKKTLLEECHKFMY